MTAPGAAVTVERAVIRAAIGAENYAVIEQVLVRLDLLKRRGVIDEEGLSHIIATVAEEIVTARICADFGLPDAWLVRDTPAPEDPTT